MFLPEHNSKCLRFASRREYGCFVDILVDESISRVRARVHTDVCGAFSLCLWLKFAYTVCVAGLRCGVHVKLPRLSQHADFEDILKKMRLQKRGTGGVDTAATDGTFDISNLDRLGMSEVRRFCHQMISPLKVKLNR